MATMARAHRPAGAVLAARGREDEPLVDLGVRSLLKDGKGGLAQPRSPILLGHKNKIPWERAHWAPWRITELLADPSVSHPIPVSSSKSLLGVDGGHQRVAHRNLMGDGGEGARMESEATQGRRLRG